MIKVRFSNSNIEFIDRSQDDKGTFALHKNCTIGRRVEKTRFLASHRWLKCDLTFAYANEVACLNHRPFSSHNEMSALSMIDTWRSIRFSVASDGRFYDYELCNQFDSITIWLRYTFSKLKQFFRWTRLNWGIRYCWIDFLQSWNALSMPTILCYWYSFGFLAFWS